MSVKSFLCMALIALMLSPLALADNNESKGSYDTSTSGNDNLIAYNGGVSHIFKTDNKGLQIAISNANPNAVPKLEANLERFRERRAGMLFGMNYTSYEVETEKESGKTRITASYPVKIVFIHATGKDYYVVDDEGEVLSKTVNFAGWLSRMFGGA